MCLRRVLLLPPLFAVLAVLGCSTGGPNFVAKHEPWREEEETACLAAGVVRTSPFLQTRSALGGPSVCGTARPFEMSAAAGGRVTLKPAALLRCPMIPQVERWVSGTVDPAARRHFGVPLTELGVAASYGCRPINHVSGARLSEHGYANALDVSSFTLADGRKITVKGGWRSDGREASFLREVHDGACREFTTVLGPNYDRAHHDHFHMDLARRGSDGLGQTCK
ncbi:MAG: extensin-like domain-containing protein [Hyphomicrobium sp.]